MHIKSVIIGIIIFVLGIFFGTAQTYMLLHTTVPQPPVITQPTTHLTATPTASPSATLVPSPTTYKYYLPTITPKP